jgi:hypothetical protein
LALRSKNLILHSSFTANPDAALAFFKKKYSHLKGLKMKKIVINCIFTSPLAKIANKEETT